MKLYVENSQRVRLDNLRLGTDDTPVNDATVTSRIEDPDDVLVAGSDISLLYEAGSDGNYSGLLPPDLPLIVGTDYALEVTASTLSGLQLRCTATLRAQERGCFSTC